MADPQQGETVDSLAERVKAQYPSYAEVPNHELTKRVLDKYPAYQNRLSTAELQRITNAGQPAPPPEKYGFTPGHLAGQVGELAKGIASFPYDVVKAEVTPPNDTMEKIASVFPGGLAAKRMLVDPGAAEVGKAIQSFKEGKTAEGLGHTGAAAIPMFGPMAAGLGEQAGSGDIGGALVKGAGLALAPKVAKLAGKAVPAIAEKMGVPDALRESAAEQTAKVLDPTGKLDKSITKNVVVPGMQERGITALSRKGLQEQAKGQVKTLGKQVQLAEAPLEKLPTKTQPVFDALDKYENDLYVKGTKVLPEANKVAFNKVQQIRDDVTQLGPVVNRESLRHLKQILDREVEKRGGFAMPADDKTVAEVQHYTADSIRNVLNQSRSQEADLNNEFHFWKSTQDMITHKNERGFGRDSVKSFLTHGTPGGLLALGAAITHSAGTALAGGALMAVGELMRTTGWRTVSAITKSKIADMLSKDDYSGVQQIVQHEKLKQAVASLPMLSGIASQRSSKTPSQAIPMSPATAEQPNNENMVARKVPYGLQ